METTENRIRDFLTKGRNALYTIVNVTRKEVGIASVFDEETWTLLRTGMEAKQLPKFCPRCPGAGLREGKLTNSKTGATVIVPELVTVMGIDDGVMFLHQLKYYGSEKNDLIVVYRSEHRNAGKYLKQNNK